MRTPCNYVEEKHHEKAMHKTKDHDNAQQQQKMTKEHIEFPIAPHLYPILLC
jgi:hypothetical protein